MTRVALFASGLLLLPALSGMARADKPDAKARKEKPAEPASPGDPPKGEMAQAELRGLDGKKIGNVTLEDTPHGVLINVALDGAPAGMHAFHVHETGKCQAPFKTAGGHFNPAGHKHGIKAAEGKHAGDMPNIDVPADGKLKFQFFNPDITLKAGDPNGLFDADGSALVLHKGHDDHVSDPAGNAGDRIACGVIEREGGRK